MPQWWFVRHGESLAQLEQWDGPDPETPLSPLGERQADELSVEIAKLPVQRVLVSPYLRARQTAERAMAKWGLAPPAVPDPISPAAQKGTGTSATLRSQSPFEVIHDLRERNSGAYLGERRNPEVIRQLSIWDFVPPDGESTRQAAARAVAALSELESDHNTIVFAHGRVLAGVLALLDAVDLTQPIEALPNCVAMAREIERGTWRELLRSLS